MNDLTTWAEPRRSVYPGRFDELRTSYARFQASGGKVGRPQAGAIVFASRPKPERLLASCFSPEWLVLEAATDSLPDIRATALVAKEIRDTLLSGYGEAPVPTAICGHEPDGSPARDPHLAIVPLAFVGREFADGHLMGFALVPPHDFNLLDNRSFARALRKVTSYAPGDDRRVMTLHKSRLQLTLTTSPEKSSLRAERYLGPSRRFATVTPIVLNRHLKEQGAARENEVIRQIVEACEHIGLPEPARIKQPYSDGAASRSHRVFPDKHSAIEGAVSAQPSGRSPSWMRWRMPISLASRPLAHAVLEFDEPVSGPVLLGAGRFIGLGLCLPIEGGESTP